MVPITIREAVKAVLEIQSASGSNAKKAVIQKYAEDETFRQLLYKVKLYDEDPRISYDDETIYITSVDKRIIGIFDRCELGFACVLNA